MSRDERELANEIAERVRQALVGVNMRSPEAVRAALAPLAQAEIEHAPDIARREPGFRGRLFVWWDEGIRALVLINPNLRAARIVRIIVHEAAEVLAIRRRPYLPGLCLGACRGYDGDNDPWHRIARAVEGAICGPKH